MTTNIFNKAPYLRTTRHFPAEIQALQVELDRSNIDIANAVNDRVIGIFAKGQIAITGESWYVNGSTKQQTLRKIFTFAAPGAAPHNIDLQQISGITRLYGTCTDGSTWYPLPYVDTVSANNQISLTLTSSNVVITAGSSAPTITNAIVVVEYLSNP
jgi:hypothetical protein